MNRCLLEADNNNGFSLVEILIAMGLFAIGSLAVVALFYSTSGSVRQANQLSEAVLIAEDYLARTIASRYRNTSGSGSCTDCMRDFSGIPADLDGSNPKANYTVAVDVTPDLPLADDTATITVTVSWARALGIGSNTYTIQYIRAESRSTGI